MRKNTYGSPVYTEI